MSIMSLFGTYEVKSSTWSEKQQRFNYRSTYFTNDNLLVCVNHADELHVNRSAHQRSKQLCYVVMDRKGEIVYTTDMYESINTLMCALGI